MQELFIHPEKQVHNTEVFLKRVVSKGWRATHTFHLHDEYEIFFSLTNNIRYNVNGRIYEVNKHDLLVLKKLDFHGPIVNPDTLYDRWVVFFYPKYIQEFINEQKDLLDCFSVSNSNSNVFQLCDEEASELLALFEKFQRYDAPGIYGQNLHRKIILVEILLFINSLFKNSYKLKTPVNQTSLERMNTVLGYLYQNIGDDLSLDKIAARFNLSKSHLCCLFKQATGMPLHKFVNSVRIMRAQEFLDSGLSVSATCDAVGYGDLSHFIRAFRQAIGVSPNSFKKASKMSE